MITLPKVTAHHPDRVNLAWEDQLAVQSTVRSDSTDGPVAPSVRRGIVSRRELFERLREAGRVVNLSAPAGSGKTILLRSWISETGRAEKTAWVSVPGQERDPQRFWIAVTD